jgi:hypothetical protein
MNEHPNFKPTKSRKTVSLDEYNEVLNLVCNTFHIDEREAISRAGYSAGSQNHWRREEKAPLVAVNALRGLLFGQEIKRQDGDKQPLRLSTDDLERLLAALRADPDDKTRSLRVGLHREIARRLEGK